MHEHNKLRRRIKGFLFLLAGAVLLIPLSLFLLYLIDIDDTVIVNGTVVADNTYDLVGHVEAPVIELLVRTGERVEKDQCLIVLDSTAFEKSALELEGAIRELEAELELKKAEISVLENEPLPAELWHSETILKQCEDKAEKTADKLFRYRTLLETNAVSKIEFEKTELENINAQAELTRARDNAKRVAGGLAEKIIARSKRDLTLTEAKIEAKRHELEFYRRQISNCRITAPEAGLVVAIPCRSSRYVERGKTALVLASGDGLMIIADVDERQIRKIRLEEKARVSSEIFNRLQYGYFDASVVKIGDVPSEYMRDGKTSVAYPVRLELDSDDCNIKIGSKVEVSIITGTQPAIYTLLNITEEDAVMKRRLAAKRARARLGD